jgi:hypothetical protein
MHPKSDPIRSGYRGYSLWNGLESGQRCRKSGFEIDDGSPRKFNEMNRTLLTISFQIRSAHLPVQFENGHDRIYLFDFASMSKN